jgi:hypothetical protein
VRDTAESCGSLPCRERLPPRVCPTPLGVDYTQLDHSALSGPKLYVRAAQSIISAVPSGNGPMNTRTTKWIRICAPSGPKNRISGLLYRSTRRSLIPGLCPGINKSKTDCPAHDVSQVLAKGNVCHSRQCISQSTALDLRPVCIGSNQYEWTKRFW